MASIIRRDRETSGVVGGGSSLLDTSAPAVDEIFRTGTWSSRSTDGTPGIPREKETNVTKYFPTNPYRPPPTYRNHPLSCKMHARAPYLYLEPYTHAHRMFCTRILLPPCPGRNVWETFHWRLSFAIWILVVVVGVGGGGVGGFKTPGQQMSDRHSVLNAFSVRAGENFLMKFS